MSIMDKVINLAPPEPLKFHCPECAVDNHKAGLRYTENMSEQWGCVVTRHDFYRCRSCHQRFVSTNGGKPEIASA